ncbi:conserved exported hypothetical protein [Nostocoides japonicum T1-X7]|uniref:Lipoprotein n=1 Tax=Nostocoides japonicum T1-X7 TaxID=1194083 RepID=A0A077LTV4_9MICO|nr:hypothetical protein [Tetrasphaera japonica]CCH75942.1 conserved exported hypothetical protein [Tetrasphaera japonica T1-X7]
MTTRSRNRAAGAAVLLAAVVLASACNDSEPAATPSGTTTISNTSPSTSTTSTTPPLTPAEEDLRSAEGTIARYWAVLDELAADPKKSLELVTTVARDQAAAQSRNTLGTYQAKSWTLTGQTSVTAPTATTKDGKTFAVSACVDVSNVNIVDKAGKSVVRAGRPDQQRYAYTVVKAPQGFFVTVDTLKGQPC